VSTSLNLLHNSNWQFIINLYQWDTCGRGFSYTILPLSISVLVLAIRRLSSSVSHAIRFLFSILICFIVEKVLSHTYVAYVFPNIECSLAELQFVRYLPFLLHAV